MRNNEDLLKQRFLSRILREEGQNMLQASTEVMARNDFDSQEFYSRRRMDAPDNTLTYTHLAKHRFVDMSTRDTKGGKIRKVSHPIHNKILYGHANNIIRRASFEYTSKMKEMLMDGFPAEI